jgi:hypothetical protein
MGETVSSEPADITIARANVESARSELRAAIERNAWTPELENLTRKVKRMLNRYDLVYGKHFETRGVVKVGGHYPL